MRIMEGQIKVHNFSIILLSIILGSPRIVMTESHNGGPPSGFSDIEQSFLQAKLPPFKTGANEPPWKVAKDLQVTRRAINLGLNPNSVLELTRDAGGIIESLELVGSSVPKDIVSFTGPTFSALQRVLKDDTSFLICSDSIIVDDPLRINGKNIRIEFGTAHLRPSADWSKKVRQEGSVAAVQIRGAQKISVQAGTFEGIEAFLIHRSSGISIVGSKILDAPGYGVVVASHSSNILIKNLVVKGAMGGGIAVLGESQRVLIKGNEVTGGRGNSNQQAGILVTDRRKYSHIGGPNFLLQESRFPGVFHWVAEDKIEFRIPSKQIYIYANEIKENLSSGIYLDGATLTYVKSNVIERNSKEGICLDNGAAANILVANELVGNGRRWGKSDIDLELDFVKSAGRLADGTAKSKVPGISLDNAIFNVVFQNRIVANYGGGIKMVRTSFYNAIGQNIIDNNNLGNNDKHFFFGIEVGGAKGDLPALDLDFTSSMGNIVFQNIITGNHYAGIAFCGKCEYNDVFDNIIVRPQVWSIDQTAVGMRNIFTNNFSQAPSHNTSLNGSHGRVLISGELHSD